MQLQILHMAAWQSCAIALGVDLVFIASCLGFLFMAEAYGLQRHGKTARHPGESPFMFSPGGWLCLLRSLKCAGHSGAFHLEMDSKARTPPQYYRPYYMMWLYAGTCGILPIVTCISAIFLQQQLWSQICGVRHRTRYISKSLPEHDLTSGTDGAYCR